MFVRLAKIYTLRDKDNNVFYVGCTTGSLQKRLAHHLSSARSGNNYNSSKSAMIRSLNFLVRIEISQALWVAGNTRHRASKDLWILERKWIDRYRDLGHTLCNDEYRQPQSISRGKVPQDITGQLITQ